MRARIGILTVRGMNYHPTMRLAQAAEQRGCGIVAVHPYTVWPAFRKGLPVLSGNSSVQGLDAVLPRQGAEIKDASLPLISHFELMGVPVLNTRRAIERARHKFYTLQTLAAQGLPVAETIFATAPEGVADALQHFGAAGAVVKPVSGRQGSGICRMQAGIRLPSQLQAELDQGRGLLVQQFIAPQGRQDLRVLVLGDQVAAAMALRPAANDFRANFHLGGQARAIAPEPAIADLAVRAAQSMGLEIAGVDIINNAAGNAYVNEVNYAPGFRALEAATGQDIAAAIIAHVLTFVPHGRSSGFLQVSR